MKSLSALLRGVTSNHNGDIFGLIFFTRIEQKKKLKKHERVRYDHDFCYVEMPDEGNKIFK